MALLESARDPTPQSKDFFKRHAFFRQEKTEFRQNLEQIYQFFTQKLESA